MFLIFLSSVSICSEYKKGVLVMRLIVDPSLWRYLSELKMYFSYRISVNVANVKT